MYFKPGREVWLRKECTVEKPPSCFCRHGTRRFVFSMTNVNDENKAEVMESNAQGWR